RRRRTSPDARRHVADAGILGHNDEVATQRDVAAAGDRGAVDLRNRRFRRAPEAHEILGVALHAGVVDHGVPGMVFLGPFVLRGAFGIADEIIAAAKSLAGTLDDDDVNVVI